METSGSDGSELNLPHRRRCNFRSSRDESDSHENAGEACLEILCRIDETCGKLKCDVQPRPSGSSGAGLMAISIQTTFDNSDTVECEATNSFSCSVSFNSTKGFDAIATVRMSNVTAPPLLLRVPSWLAPPVKLKHNLTIEAELMLLWEKPHGSENDMLRYEVRYSSSRTEASWEVASAAGEPKVSLDLKPMLNYTVQVRCSRLTEPTWWSEWSAPHHIWLPAVSYIPEKTVVRPGENVTVYCVFNDRSVQASDATWRLNLQDLVDRSHYQPINQRVSRITMSPSEDRLYDLLTCTQKLGGSSISYAQVYIEGASIDISCQTNGDIDAMVCSWTSKHLTKTKFQSKWADMTCDMMEELEAAGEEVGVMDPTCEPKKAKQDSDPTCTIQPLRMNCYKLWVELEPTFSSVKSKPVYLSPIDHVKPYPPTNVKAVTQRDGVLMVTWDPPSLPAQGVHCQFRYHLQSSARDQPEWKVESSALVSDMCQVYVVQVRCIHANGSGYWSDWSQAAHSTPQNSRAPDRGPDFWRIRHDEPNEAKTNITLLLKDFPPSENPEYCVEGLLVKHRMADGSVTSQRVALTSSYSFHWNQEPQTVTVEAYNNLGSSAHNTNMTLERQPKRRCVCSFSALVLNSSCVSLSWSLTDNSVKPVSMVIQWFPRGQRESLSSRENWIRQPYAKPPLYLSGEFFASEEFVFSLYPIFADGEGEPVETLATRRDPAVFMLMMIISFLSIVLVVTLVFSQNHSRMKKFVWKEVPNPRNCSWARGLDFKKVDVFERSFQTLDGLPAWPALLPSEHISSVVIMEGIGTAAAAQNTSLTAAAPFSPPFDTLAESEALLSGVPSVAVVLEASTADEPEEQRPGSTESSAQSLVTYATVLPSDPSREHQSVHLLDKEGSGNSSSDEGNFSANNSDISGSFPGGLWELDDPRRSCSYNSVEEFSEEELEVREEKDLYYPGMGYPAEDEQSEDDQEAQAEKSARRPAASQDFSSLYLPQFRTAACTRKLASPKHDGSLQL